MTAARHFFSFGSYHGAGNNQSVHVVAGDSIFSAVREIDGTSLGIPHLIGAILTRNHQVLAISRVVLEVVDVLLQAQALLHHLRGVGDPHIAEVPGLVGNAGEIRLVRSIADHIAVVLAIFVDPRILAGTVILLAGAVAVVDAQVHDKTGVVLAAAGLGHVLLGVLQAILLSALVKQVLLELLRAVARHHIDALTAALGGEIRQHGIEGLHGRRGQVNVGAAYIVAVVFLIIDADQLLIFREMEKGAVIDQDQIAGAITSLLHAHIGEGNPIPLPLLLDACLMKMWIM